MKTLHHSTQIVVLAMMVAALVLIPPAGSLRAAADEGVGFENATTSSYGTFNGIEYLKHEGRFVGTAAGDYSVPFEIVAPADLTKGNGAMLMEVLHPLGMVARDGYLTPQFLFAQGFSYAMIGWHPDDVNPTGGYSTEEAVEILHNFALALREDAEAQALVGDVHQLYAVSVSKACEPLHSLLHTPGRSLLDFTLLLVPTWFPETHKQAPDSNPVMVFLSEAELVRAEILSAHTSVLRGSSPTYRSYEVTGAPHVPDVPWNRELTGPMGASTEGTTPLDWTPVARALFLAGHRWATEGVEPPPSTSIAQGPAGQIDPVYEAEYGLGLETRIARDENGNALGGIRLPDLELGRGQFIAVEPASFFGMGLYGAFEDLKCEPLPDGSTRFPDHESYVSQFTQQAQRLAAEGFLLSEDAERMIADAAKSDVAKPDACAPAMLPVTGELRDRGGSLQLLALAGLLLIGVIIGLRPYTKVLR
jgi:hypothetical protein